MGAQEVLKIVPVGDFSEVNGAEILQHGLDMLHDLVHESSFLVESEEEIDFAIF